MEINRDMEEVEIQIIENNYGLI